MFFKHSVNCIGATIVVLAASQALGQFEINWHTVDGGGVMNSVGGAFSLSGTIGQHDAQALPVMVGGTFELTGGFWVISTVCNCPGDMNGDGLRNGADIQKFTRCFTGAGACTCADIDGLGGVNPADVTVFVMDLLSGAACP
jgi:hypothetical protein